MDEHFDPRLLAFLREHSSYPHHPLEISEIHTHSSLVFLVPPFVYKIKKPVDFGFLDFSTLAKRRYFCKREVALNSRLSPGIYLGVDAITRDDDGFAFNGGGPAVEYAVKMHLLAPEGFLLTRLQAGTAGEPELERVAATLVDFYQKQPSTPEIAVWGTVKKLRISTDENFSQTEAFVGEILTRAAFDAIRAFMDTSFERRRGVFEKRVADGWIRDCHGDLHLDHIHLADDVPRIYDCIEFNDRFRHLDVASDVAFLAMDLDYHGWPDLGNFIVRRVAEKMRDPDMPGLMDFYKCYRAYVRGKVECLHSVAEIAADGERAAAAESARRYFQLALQYAVCGSHPQALVFMGRVASGKSTLAAAMAHELGWRLISSDERRKSLAGVPLHLRGDAESRAVLYSHGMTGRTYDSMILDAHEILSSGHGVILDATFSKRMCRHRLREMLGDRDVRWIVTAVDDETAADRLRLRERRDDMISDARGEDREFLNAAFEEPDELPAFVKRVVQTADAKEMVFHKLLVAMATT